MMCFGLKLVVTSGPLWVWKKGGFDGFQRDLWWDHQQYRSFQLAMGSASLRVCCLVNPLKLWRATSSGWEHRDEMTYSDSADGLGRTSSALRSYRNPRRRPVRPWSMAKSQTSSEHPVRHRSHKCLRNIWRSRVRKGLPSFYFWYRLLAALACIYMHAPLLLTNYCNCNWPHCNMCVEMVRVKQVHEQPLPHIKCF